MAKKVILGPMSQGVFKLISSFEFHARVALQEQEMNSEVRDEFERAISDLEPALSALALVINETEVSETGFEALWRIVSCVVTLVDPQANKEGIAAAISAGLLSEHGRSGGKISGEVRAAKAREGWMTHALKLAKQIRAEDPSKSQEDLAVEIDARWKEKDIDCVGIARLKQVISEWEKDEKLTPRKSVLKRSLPKKKVR